jgi:Domain of unknown function (DUF4232)
VKAVPILVALAAAVAATTATAGGVSTPMCKGSQLAGSFSVVPGSAGAGNITYVLRLVNNSKTPCTVTGLPQGRLVGRRGRLLPTHIRAAFPGALTAVLVTLPPGRSTRATARFSPGVPGPGEQARGPCEPTAYGLRVVAAGGGSAIVKVLPPTAVCEHGRLLFSAYGS